MVKIVLELANGYTNFKRFRNRILYVLNRHETYSDEILDVKNIKKKGNSRGKYKQKNKN